MIKQVPGYPVKVIMIGREYWAGVFLGRCSNDGIQHRKHLPLPSI